MLWNDRIMTQLWNIFAHVPTNLKTKNICKFDAVAFKWNHWKKEGLSFLKIILTNIEWGNEFIYLNNTLNIHETEACILINHDELFHIQTMVFANVNHKLNDSTCWTILVFIHSRTITEIILLILMALNVSIIPNVYRHSFLLLYVTCKIQSVLVSVAHTSI